MRQQGVVQRGERKWGRRLMRGCEGGDGLRLEWDGVHPCGFPQVLWTSGGTPRL